MYSTGKLNNKNNKAIDNLKNTNPIKVITNGDFVSPAPLKAPPIANSIAIKGCIEPKNHTNITVNLTTSSSSTRNLDISLENIAIKSPTKPIEMIDNLADLQPLRFASLGLLAPKNCPLMSRQLLKTPGLS